MNRILHPPGIEGFIGIREISRKDTETEVAEVFHMTHGTQATARAGVVWTKT